MDKLKSYVVFTMSILMLCFSCSSPKYYVFRTTKSSPNCTFWNDHQTVYSKTISLKKSPHFKELAFLRQDLNKKGPVKISTAGNTKPHFLAAKTPKYGATDFPTKFRDIEYPKQILFESELPKKDQRKVHWTSIVSFASGLLILPGILLFSLPAIIFGIIGITKSGKRKKFKGQGWAIAGLGLGLLIVVFLVAVIFALAILPK